MIISESRHGKSCLMPSSYLLPWKRTLAEVNFTSMLLLTSFLTLQWHWTWTTRIFPPPPLWITYTSFLREKMLLQSANRFAAALWFAAVPCFPCTEPTHISTASFLTYRSNLVLLRGKASSYLSKIFHFVTVLPGIVSSKSLGTKCSWAEYITHSWSINEVFKNVS